MNRKELANLLPSEPTRAKLNPAGLCIMLIAQPKWGKTHFFMSNTDAVLLAFEEGHKFQRGHKMIIDKWDKLRGDDYEPWRDPEGCMHMTLVQAVETLEEFKKFNLVIIDTTEMMAKMCMDFYSTKGGKEHISDLGDFGKGWDVGLNNPFRQVIMRILKTGRGVGLICHTTNEVAKFTSGEKARKEARLPKGPKHLCETQADIIFHGELGKKQPGNKLRDRIMVTEGDMDTMAGNRCGVLLPERYIVDPKNPWAQFMKFFTDPTYADFADKKYRRALKGEK